MSLVVYRVGMPLLEKQVESYIGYLIAVIKFRLFFKN